MIQKIPATLVMTTSNQVIRAIPTTITTQGGTIEIPAHSVMQAINVFTNGTFSSGQLDLAMSRIANAKSVVAASSATSWSDLITNPSYSALVTRLRLGLQNTATELDCTETLGSDWTISVTQNGKTLTTSTSLLTNTSTSFH